MRRKVCVCSFFHAARGKIIGITLYVTVTCVCVCVSAGECHTCHEFCILSSDIELAGMSFHLPGGWGLLPFSLRYFIL